MMKKFSFNFWALCGVALAFTACSEDSLVNPSDSTANVSEFNTAHVTVKKSAQKRANSIDTWSEDHSDAWVSKLDFEKPADAITATKNSQWDTSATLRSGNTYYVSSDFDGVLNFDNFNGDLYVDAKITQFYGNVGNLNLYILPNGSWECGFNNGSITIYNQGNLILGSYDLQNNNIGDIYNCGYMSLGKAGDYPNLSNAHHIYSNGDFELAGNIDFKAFCDIHGTMSVAGDIKIQNNEAQYVCALEVEGKLDITQGHLKTSYVKANEITFDGADLYLLPNAHVVANKISMPNSATSIKGYTGSHALVETKDIYFRNFNTFQSAFSSNIYFNVTGSIDIQERREENGSTVDYAVLYSSAAEYLATQTGSVVADRFNISDVKAVDGCNDTWTVTPDEEEEPTEPELELIGSIENPTHDHDADKNDPNRRHLSATCIDVDNNGVFYVTYHMRGGYGSGEHYAGDTFDKDGVEGCIETWTIAKDETTNNSNIQLGSYMWTNDFDFNHLILDGNNIVTVGHRDNKGAIIGRLPKFYEDYDAKENNASGYSEEFKFKYLTTAEPLMGEGKDGEIKIDYKNAGDGNCVIKVNNEYWVATYEGYGRLNADFSRIKDEAGNVAFQPTPGSAKYLIEKDGDIAVLFLNERPTSTATAQSSATLATISKSTFPFNGTTSVLKSYVQPVDGKNVIAWNGVDLMACLGKGGLNINNNIYTFGEDKAENETEPVNGIAYDSDYIYVAAGSHLRVLDSATKKEVTHTTLPGMSANYIKLATINGEKYIAVAFGQAGIKVFQLKNGK